MKFAVGYLVPYRTRIERIAAYYRRDGPVIGIYDSVIFFHRFNRPLPPESPASPRQVMSYAIQADPSLAWREI